MTQYPRSELLAWVRHNAPDLRIGKAIVDGRRACFARFTFGGSEYELEAAGDESDDEIVVKAVEALRFAMNLPPLFGEPKSVVGEQDVLRASLMGNDQEREALTRTLVTQQAKSGRALHGKTTFNVRKVW